MKHKKTKKLTLPKSTIKKLDNLGLSKLELKNCYKILSFIIQKNGRGEKSLRGWVPLPTSFLIKAISQGYLKYINILGEAGLIDCDEIFNEGKSLYYRVNPSVNFKEELETIDIEVTIGDITEEQKIDYRGDRYRFSRNLQDLKIDYDKLYAIADIASEDLSIEDYEVNGDIILEDYSTVNYKGTEELLSRDTILYICEEDNLDLISDGSRLYLVDSKEFISQRRVYRRLYYKNSIEALRDPNTRYSNRNSTNKRLDTNFTSLPSVILEEIYRQNDFIEIDSVNSQPALLAYMLENEGVVGEDVEVFLEAANSGSFYEYFANKTGVTRKQAKTIIFQVLFSASRANTKTKKIFKKAFPTVWEYIKHIKKDNYRDLSLKLQELESYIFIDKILIPLTDRGYKVFSKHDSISCHGRDLPAVITHIQEVYTEIGFRGELKAK